MKLDVKELLNKSVKELHAKTISQAASFSSGFGYVDFLITSYLPSGAVFLGGVIKGVPNGYYIQGNVGIVNNNTTIRLSYQNTYSGTLTGTCELLVFYSL